MYLGAYQAEVSQQNKIWCYVSCSEWFTTRCSA